MTKQILFFQGGGGQEDYDADSKLVASLQSNLGPLYSIEYPLLPDDGTPDSGRRQQISTAIAGCDDNVILVGHSFGASMILVCLSEMKINRKIAGVFLVATPFWTGSEDWVQPYKLKADFSNRLDKNVPLYFYHAHNDEEVPFDQFLAYKKQLPWAVFREIPEGGHQLNNDLKVVADDILKASADT